MAVVEHASPALDLPAEAYELNEAWVERGLTAVVLPTGVVTLNSGARFTNLTLGANGSIAKASVFTGIGPVHIAKGFNNVGRATLFAIANVATLSSDCFFFGRFRYNGSANYGCALRFANSDFHAHKGHGDSDLGTGSATGGALTGRHSYAATLHGDVGFPARLTQLYRDGQALSTANGGSATGILPWDLALDVGQTTASGETVVTGALGGTVEFGAAFAAYLSAGDINSIHTDPAQLLAVRRDWVSVSASGTIPTLTSLTASNITTTGARLTVAA